MKKLKCLIGVICFCVIGNNASAQQDALYSQYMFNPFAINPAYAGSREALSAVVLGRQQWTGIDGAPFTGTVAVHGAFGESGMVGGFNMLHDRIGPTTMTAAYGTAGYHLKLRKGKLSFAMRGGIINANFNASVLNFDQPDGYNGGVNSTFQTAASIDAGMYYFTNKFYAGISASHIGADNFNFQFTDTTSVNLQLNTHIMLASGVALELNDNMVFKPSFLLKYVENAPMNVDINASMLFKQVFWFGLSYRHGSALAVITEYNITDWMRVGYSYDIVLNRLKRFTGGSHELFLGFDFRLKKDTDISPRYM